MRFLKGAFTFAAFSALAASVLGAPVETSTIVDYDSKPPLFGCSLVPQ